MQILFYFVVVLHVIVSLFLIGVVLLQQGRSADLAGAFGGQGSQTAFGPARGSQRPDPAHHLVRDHLHDHVAFVDRPVRPLRQARTPCSTTSSPHPQRPPSPANRPAQRTAAISEADLTWSASFAFVDPGQPRSTMNL